MRTASCSCQMIPLSDGIDVRQMFALVAQVDVPDVVEIDEPGPPLSRWFALEGVDPEVRAPWSSSPSPAGRASSRPC